MANSSYTLKGKPHARAGFFPRLLVLTLFLGTGLSLQTLTAQSTFTEISQSHGANHLYWSKSKMGGGAAFFDYNGDGWEDLYITGGLGRDVLFQNNGNGTFSDVTTAAGLDFTDGVHTMGVVTGDLDNDGYRELFLTTDKREPNRLLRNNRDGTFTDITFSAGLGTDSLWSISATFGDYDLDGLLDLYVGNYVQEAIVTYDTAGNPNGFAHHCYENHLYHNNGNLSFTEVGLAEAVADTGCALAVAFTDFDNDADPDLFIANDFGEYVVPNRMYQNNQPLACTEISQQAGLDAEMYGMGIAVGDYDQDLDLDYYVTNIGRNGLFRNEGNRTFSDVTDSAGVENEYVDSLLSTGWGTGFMDIDNDSWLDLYVANGHITMLDFVRNAKQDPNKLYRNKGDGTFEDISMAAGIGDTNLARGFTFADYDQDGDQDLLAVVIHWDTASGKHALLLRNDLNSSNHYLQVRLRGTVSNRDAFGAHLEIKLPGQSWVHEVDGGSSHHSQPSSIAHFGLGSHTSVDSLWVIWPGGGRQLLTNLPVDTMIGITEDTSLFVNVEAPELSGKDLAAWNFQNWPNPAQDGFQVQWEQPEAGALKFELLDEMGRLIQEKHIRRNAGKQTEEWEISGQAAGLYFLKISGLGQAPLVLKQIIQ